MNSQTKIVVIRMKWLIIAVIAAIVLIAGIVLYFNMGKNHVGLSFISTNIRKLFYFLRIMFDGNGMKKSWEWGKSCA